MAQRLEVNYDPQAVSKLLETVPIEDALAMVERVEAYNGVMAFNNSLQQVHAKWEWLVACAREAARLALEYARIYGKYHDAALVEQAGRRWQRSAERLKSARREGILGERAMPLDEQIKWLKQFYAGGIMPKWLADWVAEIEEELGQTPDEDEPA